MTSPGELSIPGKLWSYVPDFIAQWDAALRFYLVEDPPNKFWTSVRWLTDRPPGIYYLAGASLVLYFVKVLLEGLKIRRSLLKSLGKTLVDFSFFFLLISFSDGLSLFLKKCVGRLKPYVIVFAPASQQPLSFPSNHAFNGAFLLTFLFLYVPKESQQKNRWAFVSLAVVTFFVGYSRVALGEHYPLDVVCGWLLGGLFAVPSASLGRKSWVQILSFFTKRKSFKP